MVLVNVLLFIKENIKPVWFIFEWLNKVLFKFLFYKKFRKNLELALQQQYSLPYKFREISNEEINQIASFIPEQEPEQLIFFEPHEFDIKTLKSIYYNPSFFMMGVFFNTQLVGYFFLRCFINKKCFVGRLVDKNHRGKGIGKVMNEIMYHTVWSSGFRCFATISKNNVLVMKAHAHNKYLHVRKELKDDYLLVEFSEKRGELKG